MESINDQGGRERVFLLRLEGPMASFGTEQIDNVGPTGAFPGRSMISGLLANALGYDRTEADRLGDLQRRIRHAVREDVTPGHMIDYQTVDLGQRHVSEYGWTTRGTIERRAGMNGAGTHIRHRHYLTDGSFLVALRLLPSGSGPQFDELVEALRRPSRPLFIGRSCCVPTRRIYEGEVYARTLYEALVLAPPRHGSVPRTLRAWWPDGEGPAGGHTFSLCDERDHHNGIHVGRSFVREGIISTGLAADIRAVG